MVGGEEMKHFWDGFEKRAGIGDFFKNVEEAAENINKFTSGAKHTEEYIRNAIPKVEEGVKEIAPRLEIMLGAELKHLNKGLDKGLGYLKKGLVGGLGLYGASKLLGAPKAYREYEYYKTNKELSEKQLEKLKARERGRGSK